MVWMFGDSSVDLESLAYDVYAETLAALRKAGGDLNVVAPPRDSQAVSAWVERKARGLAVSDFFCGVPMRSREQFLSTKPY